MKNPHALCTLSRLNSSLVVALTLGCSPSVPEHPDGVCKNLATGDLVVTEFMADPAGSDTGKQYIEFSNPTDHTISLSGILLYQSMADGSRSKTIALRNADVTPHAHFVLSDTGDAIEGRPGYVNYGYGSSLGSLRHESGKIGLRCGSTVITEVKYAQVTVGHARQRDGAQPMDTSASPHDSSWCDATEPLAALAPEGENFGSPGTANPACPKLVSNQSGSGGNSTNSTGYSSVVATNVDSGVIAGQCIDPIAGTRRSPHKPQIGDVLVSEIMPAPGTGNNGAGEWFEVFTPRDVDLNGLVLANEGTGTTVMTSDTCMNVKAGSWLLFARGDDPLQNGSLPSLFARFDFTLADSGSSTYAERAVVLRIDGIELDRAVWTKTTKGASWQRSQGSLGSVDSATSISWCTSPADHTFGTGDRGTPGAINTGCPNDSPDAGLVPSTQLTDASVGGAPTSYDTGTYTPTTSGGSAAGGAASYAGTGTTNPGALAGAGSGGVPASTTASATKSSNSGGAASGGAPTSGGTNSSQQCRDATGLLRELVAARPGDLLITEVMSAPGQNNNGPGEWFEVLVNANIDLNGLELSNEGTGNTLLESEGCLRANASERLVFARSGVPGENGGLPFVTAEFDFTVADSGSTAHPERAIVIRQAGMEITRASWTRSTKGASWQLSAGVPDADAGSSMVDAGQAIDQWCLSPTAIVFGLGDRGTPGAENVVCL